MAGPDSIPHGSSGPLALSITQLGVFCGSGFVATSTYSCDATSVAIINSSPASNEHRGTRTNGTSPANTEFWISTDSCNAAKLLQLVPVAVVTDVPLWKKNTKTVFSFGLGNVPSAILLSSNAATS